MKKLVLTIHGLFLTLLGAFAGASNMEATKKVVSDTTHGTIELKEVHLLAGKGGTQDTVGPWGTTGS